MPRKPRPQQPPTTLEEMLKSLQSAEPFDIIKALDAMKPFNQPEDFKSLDSNLMKLMEALKDAPPDSWQAQK